MSTTTSPLPVPPSPQTSRPVFILLLTGPGFDHIPEEAYRQTHPTHTDAITALENLCTQHLLHPVTKIVYGEHYVRGQVKGRLEEEWVEAVVREFKMPVDHEGQVKRVTDVGEVLPRTMEWVEEQVEMGGRKRARVRNWVRGTLGFW